MAGTPERRLEGGESESPLAAVPVPFHSFVVKISSRCNLDCSYCFIYNRADDRWRRQPGLMSAAVMRQTALRIREHCDRHGKASVSIIFHGGEPLLGGVRHLDELATTVGDVFADSEIEISLGMQSNGMLFDTAIGDLMLARGMSIGVSLDGPPSLNDVDRVDHQGRGSTAAVERALRLLSSVRYRDVFAGFLAVVHLGFDPDEVVDYLAQFDPPSVNFLLPYENHDHRPPGKDDFDATPYADWLIRVFDRWYDGNLPFRIREFESIMRALINGSSLVESLGLAPVSLIVVETNGEIEGVDSLKAAYQGSTELGFNVFDHDFDAVLRHSAVRARQRGAASLCRTCQECPVVDVCGGGYLPNRYSRERGFDNPSIYCRDLEKLIRHVHRRVESAVAAAQADPCATPS